MPPIILAIDTSCDETSAAVTQGFTILSNIISSQVNLHKEYGGVMPTVAKFEHQKRIDGVVNMALKRARKVPNDIDIIAVTIGPGLAIALEVGIAKAITLGMELGKPVIGINHMAGHLYSALAQNQKQNRIAKKEHISLDADSQSLFSTLEAKLRSPILGILVSGKHTELIKIDKLGKYQKLGQTSDDACGEAFDKSARLLGLGYPGGVLLAKLAQTYKKSFRTEIVHTATGGRVKLFNTSNSDLYTQLTKSGIDLSLPLPLYNVAQITFSYSGLKTAFWQLVQRIDTVLNEHKNVQDNTTSIQFEHARKTGVNLPKEIVGILATLFEAAAISHLTNKVELALATHKFESVLLGGGVAANVHLRSELRKICKERNLDLKIPYHKKLMMDNAAMVGIAAFIEVQAGITISANLERKPNLTL